MFFLLVANGYVFLRASAGQNPLTSPCILLKGGILLGLSHITLENKGRGKGDQISTQQWMRSCLSSHQLIMNPLTPAAIAVTLTDFTSFRNIS